VSEGELWNRIKSWGFQEQFMEKLMPLCHTRIKTFGEFMELCSFFFINHIPLSEELLCPKGVSRAHACYFLQAVIWSLDEQENWGRNGIEKASHQVADILGVPYKKGAIPLLYGALTGRHFGPPLFDSVELLGKNRTRARFLQAIEFLGGISNKNMALLAKAWQKQSAIGLFSEVS
jgi:glutamyl-tRNA synthetase